MSTEPKPPTGVNPAAKRTTVADFIGQLTHIGFPPEVAQKICQSFLEHMQKALVRGEEVRLRGFGVLRSSKRKKRPQPPAEGESEPTPGDPYSYSVRFRPSRRLIGFLHGVDIPETGAFTAFPSIDEALLAFLSASPVTETLPLPEQLASSAKADSDEVPQVLPAIALTSARISKSTTGEIVFELPPVEAAEPEPPPDVLPEIKFDLPPLPEGESLPAASFEAETTLRMVSAPAPSGYVVPPPLPTDLIPPPEEEVDEQQRRKMPPTLADIEAGEGMDFETHYSLGISYKEMSLYEQAIRELQRAIHKVSPTDEEGRYMNCCSLLGICYREKQLYPQSVDWYEHALAVCKVNEPSYLALKYELGLTHEMSGQMEHALAAFSEVYATDISYRSVAEKIKYLQSEVIIRHERMQKVIPVRIRGVDQTGHKIEEETWIVNISRKGAGLKTKFDHAVGTVIEVDFLQAGRRHLGRVVWCAPSSEEDSTFRMGVTLITDSDLGVTNWPLPLSEG